MCPHTIKDGPCSSCMRPDALRVASHRDYAHEAMWSKSRPRATKRHISRAALQALHAMFRSGRTNLGDGLSFAESRNPYRRSA